MTLVQNNKMYAQGLALMGITTLVATLSAGGAAWGRDSTNTITGVEVASDETGTHIAVSASEPFIPLIQSSARPAATIISVSGKWMAGRSGIRSVRRGGVLSVRSGQFDSGAVHIVANQRGYLPYTSKGSADHKHWEITVGAGSDTGSPLAPAVPPASSTAPIKPIAPLVSPSRFTLVSLARAQTPATSGVYPQLLAAPKPAAPAAPKQAESDPAGRFVSLDFVASDINDVLKALALQSGVNIVTGADVKGSITVTLKHVTLTEAMDMITRLSGFQYARFGPAYVVGTPASVGAITGLGSTPEKHEEPVTEFIPFRYNTMANLTRALSDRFPGMKFPAPDKEDVPSRPKTLIITESLKRVGEVREFVEKMEQVVAAPTTSAPTEVYKVRYASPRDLIVILGNLVPTLSVQSGPSQAFVSGSNGSSVSYSASSTPSIGTGGGGGGTPPAGGGGSASPAGAAATGNLPNTLLLTGAPQDIVRARELLAQIDVRTPQMVYEARVMDITNDDLSKLGLRYDVSRGVNIGEQNLNGANNGDAKVGPTSAADFARPLGFGAILRNPYSLLVNLDALANNNKARTLASPNLSALDGQPAVVFIGDQIKYVINIQQTQTGQNVQTETATVGITLKVTGKASPDGTITLYVHPEVSAISSYLSLGNGISLPQISSRYVDTTIRVKDGETIGIGGLIREQDITNIQKVPLLGDIPFFGQLFRSTDKQKRKSEVVIFITSRILKD